MRRTTMGTLALVALAALSAGACGGSGGSGPSGSSFTAVQAQGGAEVAQELGTSALATFTDHDYGVSDLPDFTAGKSPEARSALAGALYLAGVRGRALGHLQLSPILERSSAECVPVLSGDITDSSATDSDDDGVPDSVVATFSAEGCTVVDSGNNTSFSYTGTIKVVDIGDLFGFRLVVDFTYVFQTASSTTTVHEVGTETFTIASDLADLNVDLDDTTGTSTGGNNEKVLINENMEFRFVPAEGDAIVLGDALPDGTMTVTGGMGTSIPGQPNSFSFDITTPTGLAYSAACGNVDNNPPFTAGHISGIFHGFATAGFDVTFTGCGNDPTVTTFGTSG